MYALEFEAGGILIVQIERERGVVELRTHPVGAAEGSGQFHLPDGLRGKRLAGLIVPGECLQQLLVAEKLFQHLRGHFDEVAFGGKAGESRPLGLSAQDGVHQVAELVKESDHVLVLQQSRDRLLVARREVADQRCFGQCAATHPGDDWCGGEPLVLALAGMHVEIEAACVPAAVEDIEDRHVGVPGRRRRGPELDLE